VPRARRFLRRRASRSEEAGVSIDASDPRLWSPRPRLTVGSSDARRRDRRDESDNVREAPIRVS
jgi:hypothetical protein